MSRHDTVDALVVQRRLLVMSVPQTLLGASTVNLRCRPLRTSVRTAACVLGRKLPLSGLLQPVNESGTTALTDADAPRTQSVSKVAAGSTLESWTDPGGTRASAKAKQLGSRAFGSQQRGMYFARCRATADRFFHALRVGMCAAHPLFVVRLIVLAPEGLALPPPHGGRTVHGCLAPPLQPVPNLVESPGGDIWAELHRLWEPVRFRPSLQRGRRDRQDPQQASLPDVAA